MIGLCPPKYNKINSSNSNDYIAAQGNGTVADENQNVIDVEYERAEKEMR